MAVLLVLSSLLLSGLLLTSLLVSDDKATVQWDVAGLEDVSNLANDN